MARRGRSRQHEGRGPGRSTTRLWASGARYCVTGVALALVTQLSRPSASCVTSSSGIFRNAVTPSRGTSRFFLRLPATLALGLEFFLLALRTPIHSIESIWFTLYRTVFVESTGRGAGA